MTSLTTSPLSPSKTTVRPVLNPKEPRRSPQETVATSARKEQGAGGKTGRREGARELLLGPELLAPTAAFRRPSGVVEPYRREPGGSCACGL